MQNLALEMFNMINLDRFYRQAMGESSGEASPTFGHANAIFCVYGPSKGSICKEMNNDNDLNLHSMTKLSDWLRYWERRFNKVLKYA